MRYRHIVLLLVALLAAASLQAGNAVIGFKDPSDSTLALVRLEKPDYPVLTPISERWIIIAYISKDDKIDPLSPDGNPTGDDIVNTHMINTLEGSIMGQVATGLNFGPESAGRPLNIGGAVIKPEHFGKYVYIRVFNAHNIKNATKYLTLSKPFLVESEGPQMIQIFPDYAWDTKPVWKWIKAQKNKCH